MEGEEKGLKPHKAAQVLRSNPVSCFSRLILPSALAWLWHRIHTVVPASMDKQTPSHTAAPYPARGSRCQHPASSVIHSDAQLDFLFALYIVDTPLVTPVRPSRDTQVMEMSLPPSPPCGLPRDADPTAQPHPTYLSISRAAMMTRHSEERTTATTASAVVWSYALGGCSTGSERPWHLSP